MVLLQMLVMLLITLKLQDKSILLVLRVILEVVIVLPILIMVNCPKQKILEK